MAVRIQLAVKMMKVLGAALWSVAAAAPTPRARRELVMHNESSVHAEWDASGWDAGSCCKGERWFTVNDDDPWYQKLKKGWRAALEDSTSGCHRFWGMELRTNDEGDLFMPRVEGNKINEDVWGPCIWEDKDCSACNNRWNPRDGRFAASRRACTCGVLSHACTSVAASQVSSSGVTIAMVESGVSGVRCRQHLRDEIRGGLVRQGRGI